MVETAKDHAQIAKTWGAKSALSKVGSFVGHGLEIGSHFIPGSHLFKFGVEVTGAIIMLIPKSIAALKLKNKKKVDDLNADVIGQMMTEMNEKDEILKRDQTFP